MKAIKKFTKRIVCIMLSVVLVFSFNISAFASANSTALNIEDNFDNETTNYRAYLEYLIPQRDSSGKITKGGTAGIVRQNVMRTYLKAGETVYFGSSVHNSMIDEAGTRSTGAVTGSDIVVTYPDGSVHSYDVIQNGAGYISRRVETENGPRIAVGDTDPNKYEPLSFTATTSGLYDFSFRSVTGAVAIPGAQALIYDDATAMRGQATSDIAFWDITVADQDGNKIPGRTYSDYLALSTGATWATMNALFYVVTKDGYIYKTYFENFQPFGFVFFSNNQGLTTTGQTASSIYHSVYNNDNDCLYPETENGVTFHHPNAPDTELEKTNLIFFEEPNRDLVGILFDDPVVPDAIEEVTFFGHEKDKTYYTQGGEFKFVSHGATSVSLEIDFNPSINHVYDSKKDSTDPKDMKIVAAIEKYRAEGGSGLVEINGATVEGENSFVWDGTDSHNVHMPVGIYDANEISVTTMPKAGEIHFPMIDVEGIYTGLRVERLNGAGGRDSANPSDDRFGICYNNNPLIYGTIEGPDYATPVLSDDGNYYILSDGTRSHVAYYDKGIPLYGSDFFKAGYKPTSNYDKMHQPGKDLLYNVCQYDRLYEHYSTLVHNSNYIDPEEEEYGTAVGVANTEFSHVPINSQEQNMTFGTDGANAGGGNQALIDIGTYYYGATTTSVRFNSEIEIIDNTGIGEVSGMVFFDDYNNGKYNKTYAPVDGDYPLSDILVKLVDANGTPLTYVDDDGDVHEYATYTDRKGYYNFRGVKFLDENMQNIGNIYVKTFFTPAQSTSYTINTTANDWNLSKNKQAVMLTPEEPVKKFGDIGYTAPQKNLVDLTVSKAWDGEVQNRLDYVQVKLYQVDPSTNQEKLYADRYLAAANGWKYTFNDLNKNYKYYIEEYVDTGFAGDQLVGTSEAKFINTDEFDSTVTASTTEVNDTSGYFANFTFNPNIVGPTIVITNKEIIHNYRVVFHNNFTGYSDINAEDYYRIYCRENAIPTVKEHTGFDNVYALNDNIWDIDAFYDIPEHNGYVFTGWYYEPSFNSGEKPLKWTTDTYTGDNMEDNDGDKYTMTENNVYHIYAHWVPVGTVTKDANDEKILDGRNYYGGFDLFGVQIRNYRFDPNYDDDAEQGMAYEWYGEKKEVQGLRFVASIRNGLLAAVNDAYDVDAKQELYNYTGNKTYSTNKTIQNIEYGYLIASEDNYNYFQGGYNGRNGYVYDQLKYNDTNVNGENTTKKYRYVVNTPCTSSVGPNYVSDTEFDEGYKVGTQILDHRNYQEYRIMSAVMTYNELQDTASMNANVVARPYLRYIDSNGLIRVFYSDYRGDSVVGKGCSVSYQHAADQVKDVLENVILFPHTIGGNS